ncbi:TPA: tail fiber assembly protein [Yersinia enterocolitica]|uniref:tail fiber assembly protein n=1 Tax=Yersinia enterocolitica TaxID=630 RepID=UPI0005E06959|nr:tail fiber assembly protein [Yersinia enterocolitica]EKN6055224.1 tail fiber assembly protein [Yersinia enterocolitica]ELI8201010.1 tail fiber assembly protein [Yersinia enterocolitica]CQH06650.1 tail fiber assembly protein G [Yersinia enterocolitica]CQJ50824.1 tail fiber assembly protein G [Yersinia enterocolitica]HDL6766636.1 tail fiber assembly protein [Yersinia enterocolitica]
MENLINQEQPDNDAYDNIYVVVFENASGRGMTVVNFATQKYLDAFTHDAIVVNMVWLQEMQVAEAERERSRRIWLVQDELTALQTDLMLGIIDDEGTTRLVKLKKYVVALKQLDVSTAPDITWPELPQ